MKKFIVVLIVLAVVVFGGAQIVLPGFVQKQLEAQIGGPVAGRVRKPSCGILTGLATGFR